MTSEYPYPQGCSEEYAELCAISTSGELTAEEWADLERHVARCASCASLLQEYQGLVTIGMAKIAPDADIEDTRDHAYSESQAEQRLMAALHAVPIKKNPEPVIELVPSVRRPQRLHRFAVGVGIAAALIVCVAGAYELGRRHTPRIPESPLVAAVTPQLALATDADKLRFDSDRAALQRQLAATQASLDDLNSHSVGADAQIVELSNTKASLLAQVDDLTKKSQAASDSLLVANQQREGLQQQLNDASKSLQQVKDDLGRAQQERLGAAMRLASLENEVNSLHATLAVTDKSASTSEQMLAQDRDIRDLMGARDLYIADVVDVQSDGERSRPFGRVFYTKGKSLIFYAFDLQSQPGYREAKTFQAWGKPDSSSGKAISLGIFYLDNDKNKRWVVKSDNLATLAQINAVFVTVEPKGGSAKPTTKPFLEAYLHSLPPNHP